MKYLKIPKILPENPHQKATLPAFKNSRLRLQNIGSSESQQ
jgi:hypothetical protein